ncbi:MAG TPA: glycosyltransferase family 39 protein [Gemmatimonadota bacterium]|nr:glycosyltransferase family 39 protein [Gemmatimonadota bacterium]
MSRPDRWALAGAVVSLILALALIDPYLFTGGDNVAYYALARALATGRGYVDLMSPATPPETLYPPGFPLLLVPFYWLGGGSMFVLKLESLVAAAAALWATWKLGREALAVPDWAAAAAVWLVGLAPVFLLYTRYVLSDMSYTAAAMVTLVLFQRAARSDAAEEGEGDRWGDRWWILASLVAVLAFGIRTAGVALLGAALLWAAWRRRWRRAAIVAAAIGLAVVPWFVWTSQRPPETGGYFEQVRVSDRLDPESPPMRIGQYTRRAAGNLAIYTVRDLPQLFWPVTPPPLGVMVFGVIVGVALTIMGAVHLVRRRGVTVWDLFGLLSLGVILVWPWTGDRFFLTLVPLVWLVMLVGLDAASRFLTGRSAPARWTATLLIVVLAVGAARQVPDAWESTRAWLDGDELAGYDPFWQDYFEAARWIGDHAPDAVITGRKPTFAWYWSGGRPSLVYPFHGDPHRTWAFLRENGITHILMDPATRAYLAPALAPHADLLEVVHAAPHRAVLVVRLAPGPP